MIVPVGFSLGHIILCPLFMAGKLMINSKDPLNNVKTVDDSIGSSLHVYDWTDRGIIVFIALTIFF
jgi:hypothetical protein